MKKELLISAFSLISLTTSAQIITDTVTMGSNYANQVWYSLSDDERASSPRDNWDIAFSTGGSMGSSIMVNHSNGGSVWVYPKANKSGWSAVDTTGLSTWTAQYNMETTWTGALGRYTNASDPFDVGWGVYDMGTHYVNGDSLYIIRTQAGHYKKLFIEKLASGTYTFKYANLDGSDETNTSLSKSAYATKAFGYFNLDSKTALDREPAKDTWDMVFGQYATGDYASMGIAGYTVTGVLVNDTLKTAKAVVDPALRASYTDYAPLSFGKAINGMGYNWKTTTGAIRDSNVYFIRRNNGDIWKVNFTGWVSGVSGNGSVIFTKEKLSGANISEPIEPKITLALAPNPAESGQSISLVYHFAHTVAEASIVVFDMNGRVILSVDAETQQGLHAFSLGTGRLQPGMYIAVLKTEAKSLQQQFIIR